MATGDNGERLTAQSSASARKELFRRELKDNVYRVFEESKLSNTLIGHGENTRPKTLFELQLENPSDWWLFTDNLKRHAPQGVWMYTRNAAFLKQMRYAKSFHKKLLPIQSGGFFDVWVICRRFGTLIESFRHWTVLTQGQMFHLRASKATTQNAKVQTGLGSDNVSDFSFVKKLLMKEGISTPIYYERKDFTSALPEDFSGDDDGDNYVAYHVGQTIYSWQEVERIAEFTLEQMLLYDISSYDMLRNNCQHFALTLVCYIVSTQREHIAIGGSRYLISQWTINQPGFELTPWLTKTKAWLLLLHTSTTKNIPILNLVLTTIAPFTLDYIETIPSITNKIFFQRTWRKELIGLTNSKDPLNYVKIQYSKHVIGKLSWKNYGSSGWAWFAIVSLLDLGTEHAKTWGAAVAAHALAVGIPVSKVAIIAASLPYHGIISTGLFSHWLITKTFFGRGTLTIKHMNIRRISSSSSSIVDNVSPLALCMAAPDRPPPPPPTRELDQGSLPCSASWMPAPDRPPPPPPSQELDQDSFPRSTSWLPAPDRPPPPPPPIRLEA